MPSVPSNCSRRTLLRALTTGAALLPFRSLLAQFPPQGTIDADPLRPRYHLMPRRGWMNVPCAPVNFRGQYHLFFQYNPGASVWGDMHWAHAVSPDMVRWSMRPVALAPTPDGPDAFGVFTGSMVLDHGTPTILYTCVSPSSQALATLWGSNPPEREQQCLATPVNPKAKDAAAALDTWNKLPQPVLASPPPGMKVTGFRDPVPWQEKDGSYYMLLASGEEGVGGNVLLYKSADLRQWTFQHVFAQGKWTGKDTNDTVDSGEMWECPDFFPLGDKHVLIHSTGTATGRQTLWQSGTLDRATMQWTPEHEGVLNHGPYYAPKTQLDAAGNRILWGWIEETRPQAEFAKAGWAGCMSLPRVLTLDDGVLRFAPARQVQSLRGTLTQNKSVSECEVVLQIYRTDAAAIALFESKFLRIDNSPDDGLRWGGQVVPVDKLPTTFSLRCFIDHSVLEVFVGDRVVLTRRVYNGAPAHLQLPSGFQVKSAETFATKGTQV